MSKLNIDIGLELLPSRRARKQRITKDQSEDFISWLQAHPELKYLSGQRLANRYERECGIKVSRMFALKHRKVLYNSEDEADDEQEPQEATEQPQAPIEQPPTVMKDVATQTNETDDETDSESDATEYEEEEYEEEPKCLLI